MSHKDNGWTVKRADQGTDYLNDEMPRKLTAYLSDETVPPTDRYRIQGNLDGTGRRAGNAMDGSKNLPAMLEFAPYREDEWEFIRV